MKRNFLFLPLFLLPLLALSACETADREATPTVALPAASIQPTETPAPPTALPTATAQPANTTAPPTPTPLPTATTMSIPSFDRFPIFAQLDRGTNSLAGLIQGENGWQLATVDYPANADLGSSDYAPATGRLLIWRFSGGAGPSELAAGDLTLIDLATQTEEVLISANVVAAGWAPNGLDFAYILATPITYELRWRTAAGSDSLLATDVPHSLKVSPDGRQVAFTRESFYAGLTTDPGLYVVDVTTGAETQASPLDRAGYGGSSSFWKPHWSADSSQLLLYAGADDDRAVVPHEAGFAWGAADGSFSYFLPESTFLDQVDASLFDPDATPCLDKPALFATNVIVLGIGECPELPGDNYPSQPAHFALNAQTGTPQFVGFLPVADLEQLLSWDVPGESVLVQEGDQIVSRPLSTTAQ